MLCIAVAHTAAPMIPHNNNNIYGMRKGQNTERRGTENMPLEEARQTDFEEMYIQESIIRPKNCWR